MNDTKPSRLERYQEWVGANNPSPWRYLWINTLMIGAVAGIVFAVLLSVFMRWKSSMTAEELDFHFTAWMIWFYTLSLLAFFPGGLIYGLILSLFEWYVVKWRDRVVQRARSRRQVLRDHIDELERQLDAPLVESASLSRWTRLVRWCGMDRQSPKRFLLVGTFLIFGPILCVLFTLLLWRDLAESSLSWWKNALIWLYGAVGGALFNGWLLSGLVWGVVRIVRHVHRMRKFRRRIATFESQLGSE
jgi:hypothetical protein